MSNKKILLNRRHNTFQKISGRSRKTVIMNTAIGIDSAPHKNVMVAPHVFLGLNAIGRMEVMEGFYTDYHVRSYKEKEGYFPEEYIKRIETFLRNEFPVAFFRKRHKENAVYRQSICYLLECFRINIGPSRIGKMFNQNHATVIHSRKVVSEEWLECAGYEDKVEILKIVKVKLMPFLVHMEFEFKNQ